MKRMNKLKLIRVDIKMIFLIVIMVPISIKMVINILVVLDRVLRVVKVFILQQMDLNTLVNLLMI